MFLKVLYHSWDIWSIYLKDDILGGEYAAVSFKWSPSWNCGEIHIDEQHKELFRKVSQLVI